ncbi:hypothetical protein LCGC14_1128090, partial [marine sediment metagenome]
ECSSYKELEKSAELGLKRMEEEIPMETALENVARMEREKLAQATPIPGSFAASKDQTSEPEDEVDEKLTPFDPLSVINKFLKKE